MAVEMQKDVIVMRSLVTHLIAQLTSDGWDGTSDWVVQGHVTDNPDARPPVVAVFVPEVFDASYELGNTELRGEFRVEIEVWGRDNTSLINLMACVRKNLKNIALLDQNDAEVAKGNAGELVRSNVLDTINFSGRVRFTLRASQSIT